MVHACGMKRKPGWSGRAGDWAVVLIVVAVAAAVLEPIVKAVINGTAGADPVDWAISAVGTVLLVVLAACGYDCIQTACSCVGQVKTVYETPAPTCTFTKTKETVVHETKTIDVEPEQCSDL